MKDNGKPEVIVAKENEMKNLEMYETFEVEDVRQGQLEVDG